MPSKTSKKPTSPRSPSKSERGCSEERLAALARELASKLRSGDRVLLEGPMGVGKTFFARALLAALEISQPAEGSPTFAIAHEYSSKQGRVIHVDFYRLRSEEEIEEAGIETYFWDREAIVIAEWTSMWPEFEASVLGDTRARCWVLRFSFEEREDERAVEIIGPQFGIASDPAQAR